MLPESWVYPSGVHGWLKHDEARALAELAAGKVVLEIGSFKGKSTISMAQAAKMVHSVDWHRGDEGTGAANTLCAMWRNLDEYGVRDRVTLHIGRAELIIPMLAVEFDLIFIDGSHDEVSVLRDTRLAMSKAKAGSVIAWHDYDYPQVNKVMQAVTNGRETVVDSTAYWRA